MQASSPMKMSSPSCAASLASAGCVAQRSQWKDTFTLVAVGITCMVPIIALTASAFSDTPDQEENPAEVSAEDATVSEISMIVPAFILGWMALWLGRGVHLRGASVASSGCVALRSSARRAHAYVVEKKDALVIASAGIVCVLPIVMLIVSAFAAIPGSDSGDAAMASEASSVVRAFTMGWIFCLALKLCHELVGLVGLSSCMALLSC